MSSSEWAEPFSGFCSRLSSRWRIAWRQKLSFDLSGWNNSCEPALLMLKDQPRLTSGWMGPRCRRWHLFSGRLQQRVKISIPLTAVDTHPCFHSCCLADRWRDCRWHKLDWWHVRLVFRSLKRTGSSSFGRESVCVRVGEGSCVYVLFFWLFFLERTLALWSPRWTPVVFRCWGEISQLSEHSNPAALDTRWQIKTLPLDAICWTLLTLIGCSTLQSLLSPAWPSCLELHQSLEMRRLFLC